MATKKHTRPTDQGVADHLSDAELETIAAGGTVTRPADQAPQSSVFTMAKPIETSALEGRVYEVTSIISSVCRNLNAISGDEDGTDIAEQTSEFAYALEGAQRLLNELASKLEELRPQLAQPEVAS